MDFYKVRIFFCNQRIGEYKCYKGALNKCEIPLSHLHKISEGASEEVVERNAAVLDSQSKEVCGNRNGLPSVDLVLLGTGADGHCACARPFFASGLSSIHIHYLSPPSPLRDQAAAARSGKAVLPIDADSKKSITLSIDTLLAASHAILAAANAERAGMVKKAFSLDRQRIRLAEHKK